MGAIVTRALTKAYTSHLGRQAAKGLDSLNLEIEENEVFGFLGRNGAGKTTTIKILCSLLRPTSGEAHIFGENARSKKARTHIGYLPENPYFYEYLTPKETLDFYGRLEGLSKGQRLKEWDKLADLLDLKQFENQRLRTFSKGMRQRIGFAVALVGDPKLLILDEPMSGLDPLGRRQIRELILRLRDEKKTLFFSSHVLGDVEQICDRVGILVRGKLTEQGKLSEMLAGKVNQVEVIARGINAATAASIKQWSSSMRDTEEGLHFYFADTDTANRAVKAICADGGDIVEFTQVKESLEDYFMRKQDDHES